MYIDYLLTAFGVLSLFVMGAIIGSFLNVVILRLGSGKGFRGRSKCMSCGKTLKWYMLFPLFSFIFQKGRCAYCKTKLSLQYPVVEFLSGALFLLAAWKNHFSLTAYDAHTLLPFAIDATILSTLLVISVYDLRHKIIPDALSILLAIFGFFALGFRMYVGDFPSLMPLFVSAPKWLDIAAAPVLALPLAGIWYFSKGKAMGLGDAKLVWGLAWFLGFIEGISAIVFAFWIASVPAIVILLLKKGGWRTEVPFGPFLAIGAFLVYLFGWNVLSLGFTFW